jgi:hypothetical protein
LTTLEKSHLAHVLPSFKWALISDLSEQIADLLKQVVFDNVGSLCVNLNREERFSTHQATPADCFVKVHKSKWQCTITDQQFVKDHNLEFSCLSHFALTKQELMPSKGTQPLEPLVFTSALICRHMTEKAGA